MSSHGAGVLTLEKYTFRMTRSVSSAPASDTPDNLVTTASKPLLVPPSRGHGNGPPLVPYILFLGLMFCHLPPLHAFFILSDPLTFHTQTESCIGFPTQPHQLLPLQVSLALFNILHPLHCPSPPSGSLGPWLDMETPPFSRYPRRRG